MSCSWCKNRSFMVLMSLVKRPMALILFGFGNTTARPFHCRNADMFDCGYKANQGIAGLFLKPAKTSRWEYRNTRARGERPNQQANARPRICRRQDICMACDSHAQRGPRLAVSRTAQRNVFALWVFTSGTIGSSF